MKHAYCIIAHSDHYCLNTLVRLLDHPDNDIFVLPDSKADPRLLDNISLIKSGLHIIPSNQRIDIRWGGMSLVKATLLVMKTALKSGNYSYLHLLSGADLPLKTPEQIHSYFENVEKGTNFVSFSHGEAIRQNVEYKTRYYHPFVEYQRFRKDGNLFHALQDFSAKALRKIAVMFQKSVGFKRKWNDIQLRKGSNWVSVTSDFARYLVERENYILKRFRGVICTDEIFIHTLIYNSPFRDTIQDYDNKLDESIRYIDWNRGTPYVWREEDFDELVNGGSLFARKFSSNVDQGIIDKIAAHLNS